MLLCRCFADLMICCVVFMYIEDFLFCLFRVVVLCRVAVFCWFVGLLSY